MIDFAWTSHTVSYLKSKPSYAISPYHGMLVRLEDNDFMGGIRARLLGFNKNRYRKVLDSGRFFRGQYLKSSTPKYDHLERAISAYQKSRLPLIIVIALGMRFFPKRELTCSYDEVLAGLLAAIGLNIAGDCLPRSIAIFNYFRSAGIRPKLCIGVLPPTDLMHAWVEVDGCAILEEEEYWLQFEKLVEYYEH